MTQQITMRPSIRWNDKVKLILADVDETIADLYVNASPAMIRELEKILVEGTPLFLVSGQGLRNIERRIINRIQKNLRTKILVGHCSGVEVWGFDEYGNRRAKPFYSLYDSAFSEAQKKTWRKLVKQLLHEFHLKPNPTMPIPRFVKKSKKNPLEIMIEDRGPQITFEMVNAYDLTPDERQKLDITVPKTHGHYDLRLPIIKRAKELFKHAHLPITPRLGGVFAIDFAAKGVSKTTAVQYVLKNESILQSVGLHVKDIKNPKHIEVWGDKFSRLRGGTDRHISEALPKSVRSITFRDENPQEFSKGYAIVVWKGTKHLHEGLLELLQSRG